MKRPVEAGLRLGFGVAALAVLGLGAWQWRSTLEYRDRAAELRGAQRVLTRLSTLQAVLNEAVTAQRGFILLGDESLLASLPQAEATAAAELDGLKAWTAGDPLRQAGVDTLASLVSRRLAFARSNIERRRTKGFEAAQAQLATGEGLRLNAAIHSTITGLETAEWEALRAREARTAAALYRSLAVLTVAGGVSLTLMVAAYRRVRRDLAARQQAEESLRHSELLNRNLVEHLPHRIFLKDRDSRFITCNTRYARDLGIAPEEIVGKDDFDFFPPELAEQYRASDRKVIESGAMSDVEAEYRENGVRHWARTVHVPYHDQEGRVIGVLGFYEDVTARRQAEARLRQMNRLHTVLSEINQLIVRVREPRTILEGACRIVVEHGGYTLAWIGMLDPDTGRLEPAARFGMDADVLDALAPIFDGQVTGCGFAARALATGRPAWCNDIAGCPLAQQPCAEIRRRGCRAMASYPLMIAGRCVAVFTVCAAETDTFDEAELNLLAELALDLAFALDHAEREGQRTEALEGLRRSEERFRELAETIEEVFWVTDTAKQRMLYVSPAYEKIWGRPREELYRSAGLWLEAVHPDDRERVRAAALTRQASGGYDEAYRIVRPDGTVRWIQDRAFPVRNESGQVERLAGSARDITEQRRLEEQLHQVQRLEAVGRLAGGVAHDFNNLLTVILASTDLMRHQLPAGLQVDCDEITGAAQRARSLTQQLLAFSRRQILRPEVLDLNEVVRGTEGMLRRLIREDIQLVAHLAPDLGTIRADRGQLEQVLLNLAVNARDAMPEGGRLVISTRNHDCASPLLHQGVVQPPGRYVVLEAADTGIGMDADTQQHIFEPFFTTKAAGQGTGLGLATVYGIVKQSGGYIWVYSEPGRGATFRIYFPRREETAAPPPPADSPSDLAGRGERVLLVEDEDAVRAVTRRTLEANGYEVVEARTAEEALDLAQRLGNRLDLLLSDVGLPGMSGPALARQLRARHPGIRVVHTSGYIPESGGRDPSAEPLPVLQKPYSVDALLGAVSDALRPGLNSSPS